MTTSFALGRERQENGWLKFKPDKPLRAAMFPEDILDSIMTHPAKQNAYLHQEIVDYVSNPGETILDPFGGIGTSLISACMGRNVVLVELEEYYADIIQRCMDYLEWCRKEGKNPLEGYPMGQMTLVNTDNRIALPIKCDHIITSPPYGDDLYRSTLEAGKNQIKDLKQYAADNKNIGRLPKFVYQQAMKQVYAKMVASVRVGGTITITHRDRIEGGERVLYVETIVGTLYKLGCRIKLLDKWKIYGNIQGKYNKSIGLETVEDEDIIIMERER